MVRIGAVWSGEEGQGSVAVLGSSASLDDAHIATYCNAALLEWLLAWLQHVNTSDSIDPSVFLAKCTFEQKLVKSRLAHYHGNLLSKLWGSYIST
jgi:hypothetical protein